MFTFDQTRDLTDVIRAQPLASTYFHPTTGRSHPLVSHTGHFSEWRLAFGSGNMLSDYSNFERDLRDNAALRSKGSRSVTGYLVVSS